MRLKPRTSLLCILDLNLDGQNLFIFLTNLVLFEKPWTEVAPFSL